MSVDDLAALLSETAGVKLEESPSFILFNKKDFAFPPPDLFETRAAGQLSYQVLADMCQGRYFTLSKFHPKISK